MPAWARPDRGSSRGPPRVGRPACPDRTPCVGCHRRDRPARRAARAGARRLAGAITAGRFGAAKVAQRPLADGDALRCAGGRRRIHGRGRGRSPRPSRGHRARPRDGWTPVHACGVDEPREQRTAGSARSAPPRATSPMTASMGLLGIWRSYDGAKTGDARQSVLPPKTMIQKPAPLADSDRNDDEDVLPSASARFRLKLNAFGDLVPEIVPIDEAKRPHKRDQSSR